MKLTREDIERIIKEVEDIEILALQRYFRRLDWEAEMESRHSDWGDRD